MQSNAALINKLAKLKKYLPIFVACPYTRAVFLGGSVSLGLAGDRSDIDLFIISKNGRVWLNKFFMILLLAAIGERRTKKKSADKFCLNVFMSDSNTLLPHRDETGALFYKNLLPVWSVDDKVVKNFWETNFWIKNFCEPSTISRENIFKEKKFLSDFLRMSAEKFLELTMLGRVLEKISFESQSKYLEKKLKESGALEAKTYDFFITPDLIAYHFPVSKYHQALRRHVEKHQSAMEHNQPYQT